MSKFSQRRPPRGPNAPSEEDLLFGDETPVADQGVYEVEAPEDDGIDAGYDDVPYEDDEYADGEYLGEELYGDDENAEYEVEIAPDGLRSRVVPLLLAVGAIVAVLTKLAFVADEDVVARVYDASLYAQSAVDTVWFGPVHEFTYRPGTGLVGGLFRMFGLPFRFGIELLWAVSAGYLAWCATRVCGSRAYGAVLFAALVFHPWPLSEFRELMSEPPFAVGCLAALAATVHLATARGPLGPGALLPWMVALVFGVWDSVRIETMLLVPTGCAWLGGAYVYRHGWRWSGWREATALVIPLLGILFVQTALSTANYARSGVFAMSRQEASGYTSLMDALYELDAPDASLYAPVTRASLTAAIDHAPALAPFREDLLSLEAPAVQHGQAVAERPGEFGTWLNFLLLETVRGAKPGVARPDHAAADAVFAAAARQIREAIASGALRARPGGGNWPIDPQTGQWAQGLMGAFGTNVRYLFEHPLWTPRDDLGDESQAGSGRTVDRALFDRAAQRRAARVATERYTLEGWVTARGGQVDLVVAESADGTPLAASATAAGRSVVLPEQLWENGSGTAATGRSFRIAVERPAAGAEPAEEVTRLALWGDGQRLGSFTLEQLSANVPVAIENATGATAAQLWRHTRLRGPSERWQEPFKAAWSAAWPWVLMLLAVAGGVVGFLRGRDPVPGTGLWTWLLTSAIVLRLGFFSVLVAMTGWWHYPRYLQVVQPLLVPLVLALGLAVGAWIAARRAGPIHLRTAPTPRPGAA